MRALLVPIAISAIFLLGCAGLGGEDEAPAIQPIPDPTPPADPADAPGASIPAGNAPDYSERWLVILSSKRELGHTPPGLDVLAGSELSYAPARLSSSEFKGLNPCYEIVVAKAFDDADAAVAYSKELSKLGIDNYPRDPGTWVGTRPEVEAWCERRRAPDLGDCPGGLRFVDHQGASALLDLGLHELIDERTREGAPGPEQVAPDAWRSALGHETVGDHKLDESWFGYGPHEHGSSCTVDRFAIWTLGEPHWSWHDGDMSEPGCGSATVMAELDCEGTPELVGPAGVARFYDRLELEEGDDRAKRAIATLEDHDPWRIRTHRQKGEAAALKRPLQMDREIVLFGSEDRDLIGIRQRWWTGDGNNACGADEIHDAALALIEAGGAWQMVGELIDAPDTERFELLSIEPGSTPTWLLQGWNHRELVSIGGEDLCSLERPFCDCGC